MLTGEEEEDEEATTNKTDRKWTHDDDDGEDEFDDVGDEVEEVWLLRRALIKGFCSVSISVSMCNCSLST